MAELSIRFVSTRSPLRFIHFCFPRIYLPAKTHKLSAFNSSHWFIAPHLSIALFFSIFAPLNAKPQPDWHPSEVLGVIL